MDFLVIPVLLARLVMLDQVDLLDRKVCLDLEDLGYVRERNSAHTHAKITETC